MEDFVPEQMPKDKKMFVCVSNSLTILSHNSLLVAHCMAGVSRICIMREEPIPSFSEEVLAAFLDP